MTETRLTAGAQHRYAGPDLANVVVGNYRLISEISSGGMGTVYRARHEIIGRPAAVKVLRPDLHATQELIDRFFTEAKAATAIRHPGIVEVYDFGYMPDGSAYLVMELLEGKPLGRRLAELERFSEWEAANIARGIASALKAAHSQGIVHRDLKPDNIFLVPDLEGATGSTRPKILDFGIAKLSQHVADRQHTQLGALIGTPLYMAPEQARQASAIDHRADLYSLGCILYELLTGKPPFVAEGAGELVAMHLFGSPEPLRAKVPQLSVEMEALVMRLLAKEPDERFASAGEVVTALARLGARGSVEMSASMSLSGPRYVHRHVPTTLRDPVPSGAKEGRRHSIPIILGAMAVAIAIGVVVFLLVQRANGAPAPHDPPPSPVVTPAPPVSSPTRATPVEVHDGTPPTPVETAPAPVRVPVETAPAPVRVPAKPAPKPPRTTPVRPTTENGSPIETDLGPSP